MSQQILGTFLREVQAINHGFKEKSSSLSYLIIELRRQLRNNTIVPFSTIVAAKACCKDPNDKRLDKYWSPLSNLKNTWGKQHIVTPPQLVIAPRRVAPPQVQARPRVVAHSMNGDPGTLLDSKGEELAELAGFASFDASSFGGSDKAKAKEKELRKDVKRCPFYQQACVAAGGKKKFTQGILKSVHDLTMNAGGAVCTTFALAAAHVLTGGRRQDGKVRIEVLGCDRDRSTHMYVVAGRHEASTLEAPASWGEHASIVDPWGTATYGNKTIWKVSEVLRYPDFANMYFAKVGQFYDNATPDPNAEDNANRPNIVSVEMKLRQNRAAQQAEAQKQAEPSELDQKLMRRRRQFGDVAA